MQNVDTIDIRILAAMQKGSRISISALADHAGTSTASVQRRLKRLRSGGIINREVAQLDAKMLGFGITAVVSVELERDRLDQIDAFKRKARLDPHVQNFYCVAGEADFFLIAIARDMADYEAFTHRFFYADKTVRKFRTSIVVSTEKATLELPLSET